MTAARAMLRGAKAAVEAAVAHPRVPLALAPLLQADSHRRRRRAQLAPVPELPPLARRVRAAIAPHHESPSCWRERSLQHARVALRCTCRHRQIR